jgi:multiple sugar transport system permease protein
MFPTPLQQARPWVRGLYRIALPAALLLWLLPLAAVALTALRGAGDLAAGNHWGWPSEWMLGTNLRTVLDGTPLLRHLANSFMVALPAVAGALALAAGAGFALGVYRFRANLLLFFLFVGGNFVPFQILMVPVRDLSLQLGVYDSVGGLVLFHIAFQTGFCTFFLRNFIRGLPVELIEAARLDGASEWQLFHRVVLPLLRPALAALAVLVFTFVWNDYFWAMVLVQGEHAMPVTSGLKALNGAWVAQWQLVSTASIIAALPPVLLFFALQKQFIAGLTMGGSKG